MHHQTIPQEQCSYGNTTWFLWNAVTTANVMHFLNASASACARGIAYGATIHTRTFVGHAALA